MLGEGGKVYGIEHIDELVKQSKDNIAKHHKHFLDDGSITMVAGDGRKGLAEYAPYDVIHVGAAADTLPEDLVKQLAPGGIMVRLPNASDDPRRHLHAADIVGEEE